MADWCCAGNSPIAIFIAILMYSNAHRVHGEFLNKEPIHATNPQVNGYIYTQKKNREYHI